MDGRAFGHNPKEPAEFIAQSAAALREQYLNDAKHCVFETDLLSFLERELKKALKFESLFVVGQVAQPCGAAVAPLVSEELGRKTSAGNCAKQIQAQWYLRHFCGEVALEKLKSDAARITESELDRRVEKWRDCWQEVCRLDKKLAGMPKHDPSFLKDHQSLGAATRAYQGARKALVNFIAPKGEQFVPKEDYKAIWKRECDKYRAEQAKKAKTEGRGVLPNGPEVRIRRKAKSLSQMEFAKKVGVSIRTVRRVENGGRRVDLKTMIRIAEFLDVEPESLIVSDADSGAGGGRHHFSFGIALAVGIIASQLFMSFVKSAQARAGGA